MTTKHISERWFQTAFWGIIISIVGSTLPDVNAQTATFNDQYMIQGFSQPAKIASVAGPLSGIIDSRDCREGQHVKAGQTLASLNRDILDRRVELAKIACESTGELDVAKGELASLLSRKRRLDRLALSDHATDVEIVQAEESITIAAANVLRAEERQLQKQAEYAMLQTEARQHHIVAPFDGVLVQYTKQAGEYVGPGDAVVCTIADLSALSVEFMVPRAYRERIVLDEQVQVAFVASAKTVEGRVEYISPYPHGETNTYTVKVMVDNSQGKLTAGEHCLLQGFDDDKKPVHDRVKQLTMRGN